MISSLGDSGEEEHSNRSRLREGPDSKITYDLTGYQVMSSRTISG